jgi:hypothetical protein
MHTRAWPAHLNVDEQRRLDCSRRGSFAVVLSQHSRPSCPRLSCQLHLSSQPRVGMLLLQQQVVIGMLQLLKLVVAGRMRLVVVMAVMVMLHSAAAVSTASGRTQAVLVG